VLLVVLWVRSYWWSDAIQRVDRNFNVVAIGSDYGTLFYNQMRLPTQPTQGWELLCQSANIARDAKQRPEWFFEESFTSIQVPYWAIVPPLIVFACFPWIQRFSLRTLLIATTLVAVVLGLIVYATR
jgi:hypothetical protein